mmetsp:Transcript_31624/g.76895  ORF Transcript_31624/g.76895 Transcript_31624/m.76895 type:complete len:93 (-) Transcript_31624:121-399(-)
MCSMVGRSGPRHQAAKGTLTGTTPPQRGQRSVQCSLLFDPSLPTFAVEMWTVWRPSSPSTTKGYAGPRECRAMVASSNTGGKATIVSVIIRT